MKRVLLTITLLTALSVFAEHEYIPFVEEGNAWVFLNSVQMGAFQYSIGETETIDGVEYRVIYETFYNAMVGISNNPRKYSYIREENGIVYMGIGANAQPIYDFSLQKDDTAYWGQYVIAGIDIIDKYVYVKDVSYSQIAGKERKVLNVEICAKSLNGNNDDKKHTETWIEGIGATTDVFTAERMRWDYELTGHYNSWAYYYNYSTQTSYPDDARLYTFATQPEHEYIPLLSPSSEWVELAYKAYVRYAISDTTTMNGKEYCVISGTEMRLPEKEIHPSNSNLYVREEDKRVYLYNEYAPDEEELLFDFGAKAGDRIVVSDNANNSRVIAINSVETITLEGKERNLLHVSYIYNESIDIDDTWIEGIGPTQSFLFNNIIRWGGSGYSYFHYFYDNNTDFIYPEESEVIDFSAVSIIPADTECITLHREGDVLVAVFPTVGTGEAIALYDATGRVVASQPLRQGATTASIDISHLSQGIYIAHMANGASCKVVL